MMARKKNVAMRESSNDNIDHKNGVIIWISLCFYFFKSMHNHGRYPPNQLVFGTNANLPSVIIDLALALKSFTSTDIVRWNLNALHGARENFIKAVSSKIIKRARTYCEENYQNGDKVFYKRRAVKGWKGPTTALGKEGNFVIIRHGSAFYRCHPCHLMKATQQKSSTSPDIKQVNKKEENTSNSEIKEEVYKEYERNEEDSSNVTENQIDVANNDNQEQDIPASGVENVENDQENDIVHQDIKRFKNTTSRQKSNVNVQFTL